MEPLRLEAIDGANPLGFLTALGTLRLADLRWPGTSVALDWERNGRWIPRLHGVPVSGDNVAKELLAAPSAPVDMFGALGKNITVPAAVFGRFALKARDSATRQDRRAADFAAAFGCEACRDEDKDRIHYTDLCFITGSGHQDFLGTMAELREAVGEVHLREALFEGWRTRDKGLAMRWDPCDAREYALRWQNPSIEGAWTTWGANRLAVEALPLFPNQPSGKRGTTTGFKRREKSDEFTWPIWKTALGLDEIRSLLAWRELQEDQPARERLKAVGIEEVFRATRVRIGTGANFKVSFRPARAI